MSKREDTNRTRQLKIDDLKRKSSYGSAAHG